MWGEVGTDGSHLRPGVLFNRCSMTESQPVANKVVDGTDELKAPSHPVEMLKRWSVCAAASGDCEKEERRESRMCGCEFGAVPSPDHRAKT